MRQATQCSSADSSRGELVGIDGCSLFFRIGFEYGADVGVAAAFLLFQAVGFGFTVRDESVEYGDDTQIIPSYLLMIPA